MTYAAIITHVQSDPDAAPRLACARALAESFGARLIGLGAEMIPPLAFDGGFYSAEADWTVAMRDGIEARLQSARGLFEKAAQGLPDGSAAWLSGLQLPAPALAAASRAADLIVAGGCAHRRSDPYRDAGAAELAITAGRPVLVVPPKAAPLKAERVMVAWKDTREARRALSDALPFLKAAEAVEICEVCEAAEASQAAIRTEDVADALRRRGIKATAKVAAHHPADGNQILRQASAFGADLIVLGCYGHSRLGEWVFGGVTQDLLSQEQCFLLLSH